MAYSTASSRSPCVSEPAACGAEPSFHPVFDEAEARAGVPDRKVVHPTAQHRVDQLHDPIHWLRLVAAEHVLELLAEHGADVLRITGAHLPSLGYQELDTGHGKLAAHLDLRA